MTTARKKLTPEEDYFWKMMLVRATSSEFGQPFLSYVIFSLTPISVSGTKTMGVDKFGRVYIDFDFFMNGEEPTKPGMPKPGIVEAAKVLNHEPWHLLRKHLDRFDAYPTFDAENRIKNAKVWNVAADLTINQDIRHLVPDWGMHVKEGQFKDYEKNLTTEEYYAQIMKDLNFCPDCGQPQGDIGKDDKKDSQKGDKPGDKSQSGQDKSDSGESSESEDGSGDSSESGEGSGEGSGEPGNQPGNGSGKPGNQSGKGGSGHSHECGTCGSEQPAAVCGSGAGNPNDYELSEGEAPALTDHDIDSLQRVTAEEMKRYDQQNPGKLPGNLRIWVDEVLAPTPLDWRTILRGEVKSAISWKQGKMDYNRQRRSRRNPNRDIVLPALRSPKARITVGVDVSGSNVGNLSNVLSNVVDISKKAGVRGRDLMAFNVDVSATEPKFVPNPLNLFGPDFVGGGGTDMRVAFQVFENLARQKATDICILATDLETGWPEEPPVKTVRYLVLGVMNTNDRNSHYEQAARKALDGWAKLLCIYPDEM